MSQESKRIPTEKEFAACRKREEASDYSGEYCVEMCPYYDPMRKKGLCPGV